MIHLKKNDKIIVIVGVVILIIAGIGIAVYSPTEHIQLPPVDPEGRYIYEVSWVNITKNIPVDVETYAGRGAPFNYEVQIRDKNILNVMVELSWEDENTYGIFIKRGLDTLTADIRCRGTTDSWTSVGSGNREFYYSINPLPYDTVVRGDNIDEAIDKVIDEFFVEDTVTLSIDINIDPGARIWRPLRYLRDRGNHFDLKISYEYYDFYITDGEVNPDNSKNDDIFNEIGSDDENPYRYLGALIRAGLTRW